MDLLSYENNKLELSITNTEKSAKTTNVKKKANSNHRSLFSVRTNQSKQLGF